VIGSCSQAVNEPRYIRVLSPGVLIDAPTSLSYVQTIAPTLQKRRMRAARHKLLKLYAVKTAHRLGGRTLSGPC
jgi:hypothetical protein